MQNVNSEKESRVIVVFAIISIVFVLAINIFSFFTIKQIHTTTENLYNHPLKVSNAALLVQKGVLKMHRDMKDIALSNTDIELHEFSKLVDIEEQNVYSNLTTIQSNILGEEGLLLVRATHKLFKDWKVIRDNVIRLVNRKNYPEAIIITKKTGALHVKKLENSTQLLYNYAHTKANEFQEKAYNTFTYYNATIFILTLLGVSLFLLFLFYIKARIKKYLNLLSENESKLQEINTQYTIAIDGSHDGLWDWNIRKNTVYFSQRFKLMLGYQDNELENKFSTWEQRIHPDDKAEVFDKIKFSHTDPNFNYRCIHRIKHKDGSWVWVLSRGKTLFDGQGIATRMVGFYTDISKEKRQEIALHSQEEIMIAQSRHAAMGEMISMIAHQWRQPISVISMNANNIQADIELDMLDNNELLQTSKDIIVQTQELSKTIDDFREFFKPNKIPENIQLKKIIEDALSIVGQSLYNNDIKLTVHVDEDISITTFSRELMQVCINIIKNAKEALLEQKNDHKWIHISSKIEIKGRKKTVLLSICNNGGSIDLEVVDKIFNPYFTTKDEKNGTGLGLYMSKTIVEKHLEGSLYVLNDKNECCFNIDLPYQLKEKI